MAIFWTAVWGGLVGGLAYFRPDMADATQGMSWLLRFRQTVDNLERGSLDWRLGALGENAQRSDEVLPVNLDDETIAHARESGDFKTALVPWPRELLGELSQQILREGASLVVMDVSMSDISPHQCSICGSSTAQPLDDERLYRILQSSSKNTLLTFSLDEKAAPSVARELHPYGVSLGVFTDTMRVKDVVRRILVQRVPAFVLPRGSEFQVWAGAKSESDAVDLANELGLKTPLEIEDLATAGQKAEVTPTQLLAELGKIEISGLDIHRLPMWRSLEGPNASLISTSTLYGSGTLRADSDGISRSVHHLFLYTPPEGESVVLPSWPLAVAMKLAGTSTLQYRNQRLFIGDTYSIPMDERGRTLLKWDVDEAFHAGKGTLKRYVPAWRFLTNLGDHKLRRGVFHHDNDVSGKVAVLSDTTTTHGRRVSTPVGELSQAAVWAQSLVNILRSEGIQRSAPKQDFFLTVCMALVGVILANSMSTLLRARSGTLTYMLVLVAAAGIFVWATRVILVHHALWIAMVTPLIALAGSFLGATGYAAALERKVRNFVQRTLGSYIPPEVARNLQKDLSLIQPEKRVVTVAFVDIQNFHRLIYDKSPNEIGEFLHEYFSAMSDCVQETQGQVDKFLGDALMAFWGAPMPLPTHAVASCEAVWNMQKTLLKMQSDWEKRFGMRVDFQAALQTGEVVVGEMGTRHKANYSVIGGAVSLAFQGVSMNSLLGTRILVGEATKEGSSSKFRFREVERFRSASTGHIHRLFELLGPTDEISPDTTQRLHTFELAMAAYFDGNFQSAMELFQESANTGDSVALVFVERCRKLLREKTDETWEGVFPPGLRS